MLRLHITAEGFTEVKFVKTLLVEHFGHFQITTDVRCVEMSRRRRRIGGQESLDVFRGGLLDYVKAEKDIIRWMREDDNPDAHFTTMFDLYALPQNFPGYSDAECSRADPYGRVSTLEKAFHEKIMDAFGVDRSSSRFTPYIQLHEFEALLFSEPEKIGTQFPGREDCIEKLIKACGKISSPELIDDDPQTAPSKRIIKHIPEYKGRKVSSGPLIAEKIGMQKIREQCAHFNQWVETIEKLGTGN